MAEGLVDRKASEDDIAGFVAEVRGDPSRRGELVDLLYEGAAIYDGRGSNTTARIRAWIIAAFEDVGLPDEAVPYVAEELESGQDAILVAAAAKAIRGRTVPDPSLSGLLVRAAWNMSNQDDGVTFDSLQPSWPAKTSTTALLEILASLRFMSAAPDAADRIHSDLLMFARSNGTVLSEKVRESLDQTITAWQAISPGEHCCHSPVPDEIGEDPRDAVVLAAGLEDAPQGIEFEDQDGVRVGFDELFVGRASIVAFFYTRCSNPNKCSLTITKFATLQRDIMQKGLGEVIQVAAITYDPGYDSAARLRAYGTSRGLTFDTRTRMLRATTGHDDLRRFFGLRVGYAGSLVNRHAIELFLLDDSGRVGHTWSRAQWEAADVLAKASELVHSG